MLNESAHKKPQIRTDTMKLEVMIDAHTNTEAAERRGLVDSSQCQHTSLAGEQNAEVEPGCRSCIWWNLPISSAVILRHRSQLEDGSSIVIVFHHQAVMNVHFWRYQFNVFCLLHKHNRVKTTDLNSWQKEQWLCLLHADSTHSDLTGFIPFTMNSNTTINNYK